MSSALFILTITCYLLSLVATLTASFFARLIPGRLVNAAAIIHVLFLILYLVVPGQSNPLESAGWSNYLFISFFCSGILISGVLVRKAYHRIIKGYFLLYLLSALVFIFSPSRMLGFIASGHPDSFNPPRLHISDNYYLVGQDRSVNSDTSDTAFKLVREMGFFHKTLARNIMLPTAADSVRLLKYNQQQGMDIRVYYRNQQQLDSMEMHVAFFIPRDSSEIITRKKPS